MEWHEFRLTLPEGMLLLGVGLLTWISCRKWLLRGRRRRRSSASYTPPASFARCIAKPSNGNSRKETVAPRRSTPLLDAPPEILHWQVEMHDLARDLMAEMDSKSRVLQALLRDTQQQIERLEDVCRRAEHTKNFS